MYITTYRVDEKCMIDFVRDICHDFGQVKLTRFYNQQVASSLRCCLTVRQHTLTHSEYTELPHHCILCTDTTWKCAASNGQEQAKLR